MSDRRRVVIGSRASELALYQANHVQALLTAAHPDVEFVVETSTSHGDADQSKPLVVLAAANPGLFTKDLEVGLLSEKFDLVVHSLKDMPTTLPDGLTLAAITEREEPEDVLVVHPKHKGCGGVDALPAGATIGTSSLRRQAVLAALRPDVTVTSVRGNLNTRLKKLDEGVGGVAYDALVLARAGVKRMGWESRIEAVLPPAVFPYSVGQGALGIECRAADAGVLEFMKALVHAPSDRRCRAERAFLHGLLGGCQVPIGVQSTIAADGALTLRGVVMSLDGSKPAIDVTASCGVADDVVELGQGLAKRALDAGAKALVDAARGPRPVTYGSAEAAGAATESPAVAVAAAAAASAAAGAGAGVGATDGAGAGTHGVGAPTS